MILAHYKYERGVRFIDGWKNINDTRVGDCDDFAYTVARNTTANYAHFVFLLILGNLTLGFMGLSFYWAWSSSSNIFPTHLVLYRAKGSRNWIDSSYPEDFRATVEPHTIFPIPLLFPWVLFRTFWGGVWKLLGGK